MFETKHTTKIDPSQTAGEISELLSRMGATDIHMKYEGGELCGLLFTIIIHDRPAEFRLPVDWRGLFRIKCHEKQEKAKIELRDGWEEPIRAQARRTAWRVALEWLKVQMYIVEIEMKPVQQVFLSDMVAPDGDGETTLGDMLESGDLTKLIEMKTKP